LENRCLLKEIFYIFNADRSDIASSFVQVILVRLKRYRLFVGSYMKLAVEAPTQVEGSDAMNVEIVPALRTPCSRYKKNGNDEDN
jgi:hypothetical protein